MTELTGIRAGPDLTTPAGGEQFLPPGGWDSVPGDAPRTTPRGPAAGGPAAGGSGWEASKLIADLAAGGISALVRSSRSRSFEQATQEEPEAEMPPDFESVPADAPAATDEVLHLVHASRDRWAAGIAATLHQWHDIAAMLAQVPDGARRAGFGGLGHLIDAAGERVATLHMVFRLSFDGSGRYRIEPAVPAEPGARSFRPRAETIICDGERQWRFFADEVTARPAGPPPQEIAKLLDASWLLGHHLSGGAETMTGGRAGSGSGSRPASRPGTPGAGCFSPTRSWWTPDSASCCARSATRAPGQCRGTSCAMSSSASRATSGPTSVRECGWRKNRTTSRRGRSTSRCG